MNTKSATKTEELRPCPFCGEQVFTPFVASLDDGYAHCIFCGAKMQRSRWNTRPIEDDLRKRIAELKEFIDQLIETGEGVVINYQSAWTIQNGAESPVSKVPPSIRKWRELTADRKAG